MHEKAEKIFTVRRFIFGLVVSAVLFAVCVGGVSGATHYVYADDILADVVNSADDGDIIVIMEDYVITEQVILSSDKKITITNALGVHVTVNSNLGIIPDGTSYNSVDKYTLFMLNVGTLNISGNSTGSLSFTTNYNGRSFDIQEDASLIMEEGVLITKCGYTGETAKRNNGGAIYVRDGGSFTMNGGLITDNKAGAGGAICVESKASGSFVMTGGQIYDNDATEKAEYFLWVTTQDGYGGGIWLESATAMTWTGGTISGNTSPPPPDGSDDHNIYCEDGSSVTYPEYTEGVVIRVVNGFVKYYDFLMDAYDAVVSDGLTSDTIYIKSDFSQKHKTVWDENDVPSSILDTVTISGREITVQPYGSTESESITMDLINQIFTVTSGGVLTISGNNDATITITNTLVSSSPESDNGGFVRVSGGTLTFMDGVSVSGITAVKGGAVYLEAGGSFVMSGSSSISDCVAVNGGAVYVARGTFTVRDSASIPSSNDVYLASEEVITVASGYDGSVGCITLPEYTKGRNVVDVTDYSGISVDKFTLNPEAHDEYGTMILVKVEENNRYFLELAGQVEYLIIIPDYLNISSEDKYGTMQIIADNIRIPTNSWISVTVVSAGNFNLTHTDVESVKLPYRLFIEGSGVTVSNTMEVANFTVTEYLEKQSQSLKPTITLNGTLTDAPHVIGTYNDILTFTAECIRA